MNRTEAKERMKVALRMIMQGAKALTQIEGATIDDDATCAEKQSTNGGKNERRATTPADCADGAGNK
jgi:hypothetical protein